MKSTNYKLILIREIAAEGLEGITFESLLEHVRVYNNMKNVMDFKEYFWKIISQLDCVNFYKLPMPRQSNFKLINLKEQFNMTKNCFVQPIEPYEHDYPFELVDKNEILGSCEFYSNRISVDDQVKNNIKYSTIEKMYGNSLIIVAKEKYRINYLSRHNLDLGKKRYAFLEYIGRYRHNGLILSGVHFPPFFKDSKSAWYILKKLRQKNLIHIQKINVMNSSEVITVQQLIHISSLYRPYFNIFEQKVQELYLHLITVPCKAVHISICDQLLNVDQTFLTRASASEWIEIVTTTYRTLNESCHSPRILTDKELLSMYVVECNLPENGSYDVELIDTFTSFIKQKKSHEELTEKIRDLIELYDKSNDIELVTEDQVKPDVVRRFNGDDPLNYQILYMLSFQPMSLSEINRSFGSISVATILKEMVTKRQLYVTYRSTEKHSVAYYSVCQLTDRDKNNLWTLPLVDEKNSEDLQSNRTFSEMEQMNRNPKRKERYTFLVNLIKSELVIPGFFYAREKIIKWEKSKNLPQIMDRKSFRRILDDAVANKEIEKINVVIDNQTEIWLVRPGITRDSEEFMIHYEKRLEKNGNVSIVIVPDGKTKKKKKKKKNVNESTVCLDLIHYVKKIEYDRNNLVGFSFPILPSMLKIKILHEFIWYISMGYYTDSECCHAKCDDDNKTIYSNANNWKKYVSPLKLFVDDEQVNFKVNDLLFRAPLAMLCVLTTPKFCDQSLYDLLNQSNRTLTLQTVGNLVKMNPPAISFLLNHNEKWCCRKLIDLLECLVNMGLLSRRDGYAVIREQVEYTINKEVFITDTSNYNLPITDNEIWRKMDRLQWILKAQDDVVNFWENLLSICTGTKTKMGYQPPAIPIMSKEYKESMRDNAYIEKYVTKNGRLSLEHAENIKQFGAWLPMDSVKWKDISCAGFHRCIKSWNILNWCPDPFVEVCKKIPENIANGFLAFTKSLFIVSSQDQTVAKHTISFNENLTCILKEINIVLVGIKVLNYSKEKESFWGIMRKTVWFRSMFKQIISMNFKTFSGYISLLTTEHDEERNYLVNLFKNNELIKYFLKNIRSTSFQKGNVVQERAIIRMLFSKLLKIHQFIPQWDSLPQDGNSIGELVDEMSSTNIRLRNNRLDDSKRTAASTEITKRTIEPDKIDSIDSIVRLTLVKYLTGCLHAVQENSAPDLEMRDAILKQYSIPVALSALNKLSQFYSLEQIKGRNVTAQYLTSLIDGRDRKMTSRIFNQLKCSTNHGLALSKYVTLSEPPPFDNHKALLERDFESLELKDVLFSFSFLYLKALHNRSTNTLDVCLNHSNFAFNEKKQKSKTLCHSSVYNINTKDIKLTDADWMRMTKDARLTISFGKAIYNAMYKVRPQTEVWDNFTRFIPLTKDESGEPERKRLKQYRENSELQNIFDYVEEGEFAGRGYRDLKKRFPDTTLLNGHLDTMIKSEEIFVVGLNSLHFVSKKFVRPWLVKIPDTSNCARSHTTSNQKRLRSSSSTSVDNSLYFSPEFYRDESAQFKCQHFREAINKIYFLANKTCGTTLADLMRDISSFLGTNVARQLVQVLVQYNALSLVQLNASGKSGLFKPRVMYTVVDTNVFDDGGNITFHVNPLSHLNMSNLIRDMGKYFGVEFRETETRDDSTVMDES